jgi:putative membrane protein
LTYCTKCGRQNSDDAVYCDKCGTLLEPEEETRVVRRAAVGSEEGPREIFSVSPTLLFVKAGYIAAVVVALLLAALIAGVLPSVSPWIGVVAGLALLLVPAFYHLRQKLVCYRLTDTTVEIDQGLVSRTTQNIPLRRVQDVTVSSTVFQRVLGFGDIVIDNASETGGKVVLKNINSPRKYADLLLRQIRLLER